MLALLLAGDFIAVEKLSEAWKRSYSLTYESADAYAALNSWMRIYVSRQWSFVTAHAINIM